MLKIAIVAGGSGGIGQAVARELARDYGVIIGYNSNAEVAGTLAADIIVSGGEAAACAADLAEPAEAAGLAAFALRRYGRLDLVVNCAGIPLRALATETTDEQWRRVFDVNAGGTFNLCRAALPDMIRRGNGSIITVSSMWGIAGAAMETAYSASKAAVIGFTRALAKEVAPCGIRVNCVAPGYIDTDINGDLSEADRADFIAGVPLGRAGTPQDVARAVAYLAGDTYTTGQVLCPNGGSVI